MRFLYGFTGSAASTIWLSEKFYKFEKNRKPVDMSWVALHNPRTGTVRRPIPAQAPYDFCAEDAETARQLH